MWSKRSIAVGRSTVHRCVLEFGTEIAKRTEKHLRRASLDCHVEETYIRVGGKWRNAAYWAQKIRYAHQ